MNDPLTSAFPGNRKMQDQGKCLGFKRVSSPVTKSKRQKAVSRTVYDSSR